AFFDNIILLAALYAVTVATAMFILPVIFHASHYRKLDVERLLLRVKELSLKFSDMCMSSKKLRSTTYIIAFHVRQLFEGKKT
ncbi:MAG: hypothetical protein ACJ70U_05245, partial [Nitrososphaera sp.]